MALGSRAIWVHFRILQPDGQGQISIPQTWKASSRLLAAHASWYYILLRWDGLQLTIGPLQGPCLVTILSKYTVPSLRLGH